MFGGSRSYFLGCTIQMVDPVSTKQLTSILKIKHFKNKLSCLFDFSIFMDSHKCTLDMGKEVLTLDENQIKCIKESQMSSLFKISLTEKVTIPPKTEVITIGKIEGDSSSIMNACTVVKFPTWIGKSIYPIVLITPPSAKHSFVLVFFISGLGFQNEGNF
jgi:hypothetical protein